jgi:aminoglycoside 2''-phosphotransferase
MTTQHLYLSQIRTVLPTIPLDWIEADSGQFNDVLIINKKWVFRFPRYRAGVARLVAEARLLEALRGRLPLATPEPAHQVFDPPVPGLAFMSYPLLPGEPLTNQWLEQVRDPFARDDLARQLAGFLRALHALPLVGLPDALPGSPPGGGLADGRPEWEAMYAEVREKLFSAMRPDARKQVTAHFETFLDDHALQIFPPVLRHGDFGGDNILWDPTQTSVKAVIDFAFCAIGDPAYDLASISTLGEDFFQRLLPWYELDETRRDGLVARARFYRGVFALMEALDGLRDNDPQAYQRGMEGYIA